jgi:thiamine biosynthesis protein ThiS
MPANELVKIQLNGIEQSFPLNATVLDAIRFLNPASEFVAAELNEKILEKAAFGTIQLKNGDILEIIQPLGGGSR